MPRFHNALIVTAHPEPQSFTMALAEQSETLLTAQGIKVVRSDLHQMGFSAACGRDDFAFDVEGRLDVQDQQIIASKENSFSPQVQTEVDKLKEADLVIFHFPLWWFSVPALLKGWFDRVLACGFAYGRGANMAGKSAMVVTSTGGPLHSYQEQTRGTVADYLRHVEVGTIQFCKMELLPMFVAYAPGRLTDEERIQLIENYNSHLLRHFTND